MFFVFFVSRLVCSTATWRKEGVPDEHEGRRWSRWRGWRALIYRGNRSLFLSRRLSRSSHLDRYRLVIAFRYLNISAWWNLSDEFGRFLRKVESIFRSMMCSVYEYVNYYLLSSLYYYAICTVLCLMDKNTEKILQIYVYISREEVLLS